MELSGEGWTFCLKKNKKKLSLHFRPITSEIYYRRNHLRFIIYSTILEKLVHLSENSWPGTWLLTFWLYFNYHLQEGNPPTYIKFRQHHNLTWEKGVSRVSQDSATGSCQAEGYCH